MKQVKTSKTKKVKSKKPVPVKNFQKQKLIVLGILLFCAGLAVGVFIGSLNKSAVLSPPKTAQSVSAVTKDQTPGQVISNVEYCNGQHLDIYEPSNLQFERSPVVVYIHGGGWVLNDKASEPDQLALLDNLRAAGYTIVSLNYGKVPNAYYPTPVEDGLCAIRFLRAHAEKYYLNSDSIAVYGFSAGGYIAANIGLLADDSVFETSAYNDQSSRVQAVVTLAGLFDFTDGLTDGNRERIARFLNGANPISAGVMPHITPDDPAFLLIHGSKDLSVPIAQDDQLAASLQAKGVRVERLVVEYAEHGLNPSGGDPRPSREDVKNTITSFVRSMLE